MRVETVGQSLPAVTETARLGLVHLGGIGIMQYNLVSVCIDEILHVLVAHHDYVAAFAIVHVFGNPCVAEGHVAVSASTSSQ